MTTPAEDARREAEIRAYFTTGMGKVSTEGAEAVLRIIAAERAKSEGLRTVVQSYFDAIDWVAADSFDMCPECRSKLDHAQANGRAALSASPSPNEAAETQIEVTHRIARAIMTERIRNADLVERLIPASEAKDTLLEAVHQAMSADEFPEASPSPILPIPPEGEGEDV
jgi:hypothetical protein